MNIRMIAWVAGSTFLLALGAVGAVACSSDNGTGNPTTTPGTDSGTHADSGNSSSSGGDSGNGGSSSGGDSGNGGSSSGGNSCPSLHPVDAGTGPYCPFSGVGDAGNATCDFGQHCCEPPQGGGASTCNADCTAMADGGTDWACQGSANCPSGQVCCAVTAPPPELADSGCSPEYHFLHHFSATVCAASCAAGQVQVCENTSGECTSGTCQTAKAKGGSFGLCL